MKLISTSDTVSLSGEYGIGVYFNTNDHNICQPLPNPVGNDGVEYCFVKATDDRNSVVIVPEKGAITLLDSYHSSVTYRAFNGIWFKVSLIS